MHLLYPPPAVLARLGEEGLARFVRSNAEVELADYELRCVLDIVRRRRFMFLFLLCQRHAALASPDRLPDTSSWGEGVG
jgi:hypothetical protein